MTSQNYVKSDGGRAAAGYSMRFQSDDCLTRSLAIILDLPYKDCLFSVSKYINKMCGFRKRKYKNKKRYFNRELLWDKYLEELGFEWVTKSGRGIGISLHLKSDELPEGSIIARCSGEIIPIVNKVIYAPEDPTRDGTRGVYGYWIINSFKLTVLKANKGLL